MHFDNTFLILENSKLLRSFKTLADVRKKMQCALIIDGLTNELDQMVANTQHVTADVLAISKQFAHTKHQFKVCHRRLQKRQCRLEENPRRVRAAQITPQKAQDGVQFARVA